MAFPLKKRRAFNGTPECYSTSVIYILVARGTCAGCGKRLVSASLSTD